MSNTIFLVGARAAGKTTMGKLLANQLNYSFVDTDIYLLETTQKTVAEIVEKEGWEGFRARESQVLRAVVEPKRVIATGGGMVLADSNRDFMKSQGTVFYLSAPARVLAERLAADPNVAQRPSLTGLSIIDEMEKVLLDRQPLYHDAAHHILDAAIKQDEVLQQMLQALQK
ncbi:shikimate kinase AroL [Utexia brackfieldae]|uniref:shikimate kinase AroL n=1 Tax=Utexia brackfieldae TaxID=3074108 RepID=UPI00370DDF29